MHTLLRIAAAAAIAVTALGASAQAPKYQLEIAEPADGAVIFTDGGDVMVRAMVVPSLANGDQLQLLVDGAPAAASATTLEFALSGIIRGLHLVQATVIDATGNVGSNTPSITLYVLGGVPGFSYSPDIGMLAGDRK